MADEPQKLHMSEDPPAEDAQQTDAPAEDTQMIVVQDVPADGEKSNLQDLFDQYDIDKDGVLTIDEFKTVLLKSFKEDDDIEQLRRKADKIFKRLDTDSNGKVDFEEFKKGYHKVKKFMDNTQHRKAEKVVESMPGGEQVNQAADAFASMVGASIFEGPMAVDDENKPLTESEAEDEDKVEKFKCLILVLTIFLQVLGQLLPFIFVVLGWTTGQSCDQPLDEFCMVMSIIMIFSMVLNGIVTWAQFQPESPSLVNMVVALKCLALILEIAVLVYFIMGCIWFSNTGGLFSDPEGNCQTVAKDLWDYTSYYFWTVFIVLMVVLSMVVCFACLMCCMLFCSAAAGGRRG